MPTPAERTALLFLTAVLVAGGAVRLTRAAGGGKRPPPAASALLDQRRALDSAAGAKRAGGGAGPAPGKQPSPTPARTRSSPQAALLPIEINRATAEQLQALPRIGPALAARIVAERDANGPFTSLAALEARVRGIGPALARTIDTLIRF